MNLQTQECEYDLMIIQRIEQRSRERGRPRKITRYWRFGPFGCGSEAISRGSERKLGLRYLLIAILMSSLAQVGPVPGTLL